MKKHLAAVLPIILLWADEALAQTAAPLNNDEISKEADNPVSRQITLPLRYQADFLDGADQLTKSTLEVDQAVVPFRLNDDWSLITRTKLPYEVLPPKKAGDPWADGLSNGYTTFFYPRNTAAISSGAPAPFSIIRRPTHYWVRRNGAPVPRWRLCTRTRVRGSSVSSPITSGHSTARRAATLPTRCCSTRFSVIISATDGRCRLLPRSQRTGSPLATNGRFR